MPTREVTQAANRVEAYLGDLGLCPSLEQEVLSRVEVASEPVRRRELLASDLRLLIAAAR